MDIDNLLTSASLLLAIYALLSRSQRLNLSLKIRQTDLIFLGIVFIAIHYLFFYKSFALIGLTPKWHLGRWGITPRIASYGLFLGSSVLLAISIRTSSLPRRKIGRLKTLVEELSNNENYAELIAVLEHYLPFLEKIYAASTRLEKSKKYLLPERRSLVERMMETGATGSVALLNSEKANILVLLATKLPLPLRSRLINLLPDYSKDLRAADELLQLVLSNRSFSHAITKIKPYFGITILKLEEARFDKELFEKYFLRNLLANNSSVIYHELKNNQNMSKIRRYSIPESNKLLHFLFSDVRVAEKLGVWKPIGEQVLGELDRLHLNPKGDLCNLPVPDTDEEWYWESQIYAGIFFFDIMVTESIEQNVQWHMWLFYYTHFTERICRNFEPNEKFVNSHSELQTKYSYFLGRIISTLTDWIKKVEDVPLFQENIKLSSTYPDHDNGNIIKSSILALGKCLNHVATTERIPRFFKKDMFGYAISLYFDLKARTKYANYAVTLLKALLRGGVYEEKDDGSYLGNFLYSIVEHDNIPNEPEHVNEAIQIITDHFISRHGIGALSKFVNLERKNAELILHASSRHSYSVEVKQ